MAIAAPEFQRCSICRGALRSARTRQPTASRMPRASKWRSQALELNVSRVAVVEGGATRIDLGRSISVDIFKSPLVERTKFWKVAALIQLSESSCQLLVVIKLSNAKAILASMKSSLLPSAFRTFLWISAQTLMVVAFLNDDCGAYLSSAFSISNAYRIKRRNKPCPPSNGGGANGISRTFRAERSAAAAATVAIFLHDEPRPSAKAAAGPLI